MKLAYFLRGLGIGIIFCAIVFSFSKGTTSTMTDEEIISRAKELGMVEDTMSDQEVDALLSKKDTEATMENSKKSAKDKKTTEAATTEQATTKTTGSEAAATTEEKKDATTQVETTQAATVSFTVTKGMYSEKASESLAYLGVVKDAKAFNSYLINNDFADHLRAGTYTLTPGEDYYSIAKKITSR